MKHPRNIHARLAEKSLPVESGCIEWQGFRQSNGYGYICYQRKNWRVHRLVWTLHKGPITRDIDIMHKCDNPSCCNIHHLEIGTRKQNLQDSVDRGRHPQKIKTHCKRGHELSGENVYVAGGFRHCRICEKAKQRMYAGWPEKLAFSVPIGTVGEVPDGMVRVEPAKRRKQLTETHCKNGHEFTEANIYTTPDGYRKCRACRTASAKKWKPWREPTEVA